MQVKKLFAVMTLVTGAVLFVLGGGTVVSDAANLTVSVEKSSEVQDEVFLEDWSEEERVYGKYALMIAFLLFFVLIGLGADPRRWGEASDPY